MVTQIRSLFASPVFEDDEDKTRFAGLIHTILKAIAVGAVVYTILWPIIEPDLAWRLVFILPFYPLLIVIVWLNHIGKVQEASLLLVSGIWLIMLVAAVSSGGVRSAAFGGNVLVILFAQILLGQRFAIRFALLTVVLGVAMVVSEGQGIIPHPEPYTTPESMWVAQSIYFFVAIVLLNLATFNIRDALVRARKEIEERKRAELALREAELRYRTLVEKLPVVTYRDAPDVEGTSLYISPQIENLVGYSPEVWLENPLFWHKLLHPDDFDRVMADLAHYVHQSSRSVIEYRLRTKDGRWVWVRDEADVMTDENNQVLFVQGTLSDITDRKNAEEALRASEEKFNKAFNFSPVPMAISSPIRGYVDVNEAFSDLLGLPQEKIIGRMAREVGMWLDVEVQQKVIASLYANGQFREVEFSFRRNNGEIGIALGSGTMIDVNSESCALTSIYDITHRKQAEEALRASEEKFQKAFLSSPISMMINSPSRGILNVNRAFEELTGFQRADILEKHAHEMGLWVDMNERQASIDLVRKYDALYDFEFRFRKKDGEVRVGSLAVDLIEIENEKCYLASFQDITVRKEAEETLKNINSELEVRVQSRTAQLEAANQELESFSYSISHDLRSPLRAINGFSRLMVEDYNEQLPSEAKRLLSLVQENALKMGRLIDDLLAFSRLGRSQLQMSLVNPRELIEEVWNDLAHERVNRKIEISIADLVPCQADPSLLRQVFANLLGNAIKFTRPRENAWIKVGNQMIDEQNIYYVKDNGAGFDMEYANQLFGVFQRLHHENEFEGTGVGLATVQRIIHRHGGKIWAEAEPDQGATFFFTLPPAQN